MKNSRCCCIGWLCIYKKLRCLPRVFTDTEKTAQKATHQFWTLNHHDTHKTHPFRQRLQEKQQINNATTITPTKNCDGKIQQAKRPMANATIIGMMPSFRRRRRIKYPPASPVSVNRICRGVLPVSIFWETKHKQTAFKDYLKIRIGTEIAHTQRIVGSQRQIGDIIV